MRRGSVARRLALASRRVMLRTQRTPLRLAWRLAYMAIAHAVAAYLRHGQAEVSAYLTGSVGKGDPIYGISDIDIAVVLPPGERGAAAREVLVRRWERLRRAMPALSELLLYVAVFEQPELEELAKDPVLTYELDHGATGAAAYAGGLGSAALGRSQQPGPYGPFADWRRIAGADRLPPAPDWDRQRLRIAAWLELQMWWRYLFAVCVDPRGPRAPYLCQKLVSEPLRILVFLATGERLFERMPALRRAAELFPTHRRAIEWALALGERLHRSPEPPLAEAVPHLIDLSVAIARRLEDELAGAGGTAVRLIWDGEEELALGAGAREGLGSLMGGRSALVPLVDWRALARPEVPDDAFALASADPRDPAVLAASAVASRRGPYLALSSEGLLVLPADDRRRCGLRAVQCACTDPVSLALASGGRVASFPEASGWSARDWARRAVAERGAHLEGQETGSPGETIGLLLSAARAALFLDSLADEDPELLLTAAAVSERLAGLEQGSPSICEAALDAYRAWRSGGSEPPAEVVAGLRELVCGLAPYGGATR